MSWVAGVDGCRAGWVVALVQQQPRGVQKHYIRFCNRFAEVLTLAPRPAVIAIDIPIGLLEVQQPGGRECDRQARRLLGRRASSVFTPPTRALLEATRYEQVRSHGVSIQAFGILPKIREVDRLMTLELQTIVREAHPELAFRSLTGAPLQHNKKTSAGREERLRVLEQAPGKLFREIRSAFENGRKPSSVRRSLLMTFSTLTSWRGQLSASPRGKPTGYLPTRQLIRGGCGWKSATELRKGEVD